MRILAFLTDDVRRGCEAACGRQHRVTYAADVTASVRALRDRKFDAVILDPDLLEQSAFDHIVTIVSDLATPMVLYTTLSSATARRVVQLAERSAVELVIRGAEDMQLIAHKLGLLRPTVPAVLLNRTAPRLRPMPERLQAVTLGLFGNGPLPRWVGGLTSAAGLGRRTVDRYMHRTGINGAATLLDTARLARVWEPFVEEKRPLIVIAEEFGYGRARLLASHVRRLVGVSPEDLGVRLSRAQFAERLAGKLLQR